MPLELVYALTNHLVSGDFNERHPGIRYEDAPFMAALYENSEGRPSLAAGLVGRHPLDDHANLFGEIGLATGYSIAPVVPMGRAGLEYNLNDQNALRGFAFPAVNKEGEANLGLGLEFVRRF